MNQRKSVIEITSAAICSAISAVLGILPPIYVTPWFMRIDLVAVPWMVCWIVFGFRAAIISALISIPIVGFFEPFAGGWVGGIMKFTASVWMFAIPALFAVKTGGREKLIRNKKLFVVIAIASIMVRDIVSLLFNFYFALPVFFNMSVQDIANLFSWARSPIVAWIGVIGLYAFIAEVAIWNTIQGIIDLLVSWVVGTTALRTVKRTTS
jgi:riboflavin transporter FmnP